MSVTVVDETQVSVVVRAAGPSVTVSSPTSVGSVTVTSAGVVRVSAPAAVPAQVQTTVVPPAQVKIAATGLPGTDGTDGVRGDKGDPGDPGAPGAPGALANLLRTAAVDLSGHRAVSPRADDTVDYADYSVLADTRRPIWLTLGAAQAGDTVELEEFGIVDEPSWSWTPGPIYLGANGVLTQTPPTFVGGAAFLLQVAQAETATRIQWSVGIPIALSS